MNCKDIESRVIDYIDKQLSVPEAHDVKMHIETCTHCLGVYEETLQLMKVFENEEQHLPGEHLRANFVKTLEEEKQLLSKHSIGLEKTSSSNFNWKLAFQIAASLLILFSGYYAGTYSTEKKASQQILSLKEETVQLKENMMLALLENRSASKRIQAVNFSEEMVQPDSKIIEALIDRMQYDSNVNVRLAAAEALSGYNNLEDVKKAFIEALSIEKNPSLQIAIIQFLVKTQEKRALAPMQKLLEQPDIPDYVKEQANDGIQQII